MTYRFRLLAGALAVVTALATGLYVYESGAVHTITIAAGPADGEGFTVARAIAEVIELYEPRYRAAVLETSGSSENIALLGDGRVDMALSQANVSPGPSARLVAELYPEAFQVVARSGVGIDGVADLRGKRIALPPRGSGDYETFWFLAGHYGLSETDLEAVPMSTAAADWAMLAEAVDAVFRVRAPGNASIRELIHSSSGHLVPLDQATALRLSSPSVDPGTIPKGSYGGDPPLPEVDLPTASVQRLLLADADLATETVSDVTRLLFERRRELVARTALAGFIAAPDRYVGTLIPIHPGAQRYYDRDRPSFVQANAELIALILSVVLLVSSGILQLVSQRRRRRIDRYNNEVLTLYDEGRHLTDPHALRRCRERLMGILGRVLDDAEEGRVTEEGFNLFSFTWTAVDARFGELIEGMAASERAGG